MKNAVTADGEHHHVTHIHRPIVRCGRLPLGAANCTSLRETPFSAAKACILVPARAATRARGSSLILFKPQTARARTERRRATLQNVRTQFRRPMSPRWVRRRRPRGLPAAANAPGEPSCRRTPPEPPPRRRHGVIEHGSLVELKFCNQRLRLEYFSTPSPVGVLAGRSEPLDNLRALLSTSARRSCRAPR